MKSAVILAAGLLLCAQPLQPCTFKTYVSLTAEIAEDLESVRNKLKGVGPNHADLAQNPALFFESLDRWRLDNVTFGDLPVTLHGEYVKGLKSKKARLKLDEGDLPTLEDSTEDDLEVAALANFGLTTEFDLELRKWRAVFATKFKFKLNEGTARLRWNMSFRGSYAQEGQAALPTKARRRFTGFDMDFPPALFCSTESPLPPEK